MKTMDFRALMLLSKYNNLYTVYVHDKNGPIVITNSLIPLFTLHCSIHPHTCSRVGCATT